ncbi:MAG: hypothetical protein ACFCUG_01800 [Thiotrichales bacterium]
MYRISASLPVWERSIAFADPRRAQIGALGETLHLLRHDENAIAQILSVRVDALESESREALKQPAFVLGGN